MPEPAKPAAPGGKPAATPPRPRGFQSHRADFDQRKLTEGEPPPAPEPPKGFETSKTKKGFTPGLQPTEKPKGFKTHKRT